MEELTTKQRIFVEEYLRTWNATEAADRAGYAHPNNNAHRLLRDRRIKAAIEARLAQVEQQTEQVLGDTLRDKVLRIVRGGKAGHGFVYFVRADNGLIKIGKAMNVQSRLQRLNYQLPYDLDLIYVFESDEYGDLERTFHRYYSQLRMRGKSEWFALNEHDLLEAPFLAQQHGAKQIK